MKARLVVLVVIIAVALLAPGIALARGGGGGGGRGGGGFGGGGRSSWGGGGSSSWGGSRSTSGGSSGRSTWGGGSTWGSGRSTSPSSPSFGGGRSSATTARSSSATDRALYNQARTQGTAFSNRDSAASDFKSRYGSQYTSRFSREPSARPTYIPQSTMVGGRSVTVIYNGGFGGYGYYHPLTHAWIMYDMMADAAMMNMMMSNRGYYYGAPPPVVYTSYFPWGFFFFFIFAFIVVAIIVSSIRRRRAQEVVYVDPYSGATVIETYEEPVYAPAPPSAPVYGSAPVYHTPDRHVEEPVFSIGSPWGGITLDSVIMLSDQQAIQDSIKAGNGAVPRNYTVVGIRTIVEQRQMATWKLYRLNDSEQELWLMAKMVDGATDLRVYYALPDDSFHPGNRRDLIERGDTWLFQQPADPQHFTYDALEYTYAITGPSEDGKPPVTFALKEQGVLNGAMTAEPPEPGIVNPIFVTLAEYQAPDGATDNPELLLLEIGGVDIDGNGDNPYGGLITLWQGAAMDENEIEVLKK